MPARQHANGEVSTLGKDPAYTQTNFLDVAQYHNRKFHRLLTSMHGRNWGVQARLRGSWSPLIDPSGHSPSRGGSGSRERQPPSTLLPTWAFPPQREFGDFPSTPPTADQPILFPLPDLALGAPSSVVRFGKHLQRSGQPPPTPRPVLKLGPLA